jgi:hypothetical protein
MRALRDMRVAVPAVALGLALVVAGTVYAMLPRARPASGAAPAAGSSPDGSTTPGPTASQSAVPSGSASPSPSRSAVPATRLLFGMGSEADGALRTPLVKRAPVRMLTSWFNSPNDLSWMAGWKTGVVRRAYAAGYALHLIVYAADPEVPLSTPHGPSCGRGYPLSSRFASDMTTLAGVFAGTRTGPPLYVTLFTEFQAYPCKDNGWSADAEATNYYLTLIDQFRTAYRIFHQHAPNARVSLGWGGWQASFDDPAHGGGRSMFAHFADVMRSSDFQSFQAMDSRSNASTVRGMVQALRGYGPVMLAHFQNDSSAYDADVRALLDDRFLAEMVGAGLFALSFMDDRRMAASPATLQFIRGAVQRWGRNP